MKIMKEIKKMKYWDRKEKNKWKGLKKKEKVEEVYFKWERRVEKNDREKE